MARFRGQLWTFLSHTLDGLKQPIFSPLLLGDYGGTISLAQMGVGTYRQRSTRNFCVLNLEHIGSPDFACGWSGGISLGRHLGSSLGGSVFVFESPYPHATGEGEPGDGIWLGTKYLLYVGTFTPGHGLTHLCTYPEVFCTYLHFVSEWQGS